MYSPSFLWTWSYQHGTLKMTWEKKPNWFKGVDYLPLAHRAEECFSDMMGSAAAFKTISTRYLKSYKFLTDIIVSLENNLGPSCFILLVSGMSLSSSRSDERGLSACWTGGAQRHQQHEPCTASDSCCAKHVGCCLCAMLGSSE